MAQENEKKEIRVIEERGEKREHFLDILRGAKKGMATNDVVLLKELSNRTIHTASVYQDADSIALAVNIYALSKIIERLKYMTYKEWPSFLSACRKNIDQAILNLEQDKTKRFRENLANVRKAINKLSGHLKIYISEVFRKAQINKASRIYEHGISLSETAELLGITEFELAEYAGKTGISDVNLSLTTPIKDRLRLAKKLFE